MLNFFASSFSPPPAAVCHCVYDGVKSYLTFFSPLAFGLSTVYVIRKVGKHKKEELTSLKKNLTVSVAMSVIIGWTAYILLGNN